MKKFSEYLAENQDTLFVVVKNGSVQLRSTNSTGAHHTFGRNIAFAVLQGDSVIATTKSGVTQIYKVNLAAKSVSGPTNSF